MAKATRVVLICDFHDDDTEAVETVRFQVGRSRYELDLCKEHLDEMTGAARKVRAATRTSSLRAKQPTGTKRRTSAKAKRSSNATKADVRAWARKAGYSVSDR